MIALLSGGAVSLTAIAAATLLLSFLPFLLSLAGQGSKEGFKATTLCLITSTFTLLLSHEPDRAGIAWIAGMALALVSIWERIRQRYPV
jgi:hypothetical protein